MVSGLEGFHCIKIWQLYFFCSERNIHIRREPQNERHFEAGYVRVVRRRTFRDYLPPEPVRSALIPPRTRWEWLDFLLVHVPIISWLLSYRPSFLINDIVSGVTVAIMHIPQGMMVGSLSAYHLIVKNVTHYAYILYCILLYPSC